MKESQMSSIGEINMHTITSLALAGLLVGLALSTGPVVASPGGGAAGGTNSSGMGMSQQQQDIRATERRETAERERLRKEDADTANTERRRIEEQQHNRQQQPETPPQQQQQGMQNPGMDRQREMRSEQQGKEAGRGSKQGQAMREEHSHKWWRFWD